MTKARKLDQIIPQELLNKVRRKFIRGIKNSEKNFAMNAESEDALTGALGQAIATQKTYFHNAEGNFSYEITSKKIRGLGPNPPEFRLGADGIFQILVLKNDSCIFSKGLPFQAKIEGGFLNDPLIEQACKIRRTAKTGIIVRYSEAGYTAVNVRKIVDKDGLLQIEEQPTAKSLKTIVGNDFLNCLVGKQGLRYDELKETPEGRGTWVFDTLINIYP